MLQYAELNVAEQVDTSSGLPAIQTAAERGRALEICGWVYGVNDGLLKALGTSSRLPRTA